MAIKNEFEPSGETVTQVNELVIPGLGENQILQLEQITPRFITQYNIWQSLLEERGNILNPRLLVVESVEISLRETRQELKRAQITIETSRTDPELVKHRFLEKLHSADPNRLPTWLRLIRSLSKPTPNPLTQPLQEEMTQLQSTYEQAKQELAVVQRQVTEQVDPRIAITFSRLGQAKNGLIRIWEPTVTQDLDLAGKYVVLMPGRAEDVARTYAKLHAHEDHWLQYRPKFERDLKQRYPDRTNNPNFIEHHWLDYIVEFVLREWK